VQYNWKLPHINCIAIKQAVYGKSLYLLMPYVLYALVALEISVSMYKMKHNPSHYSIKTHLNKSQTFRNVQKYVQSASPRHFVDFWNHNSQ